MVNGVKSLWKEVYKGVVRPAMIYRLEQLRLGDNVCETSLWRGCDVGERMRN